MAATRAQRANPRFVRSRAAEVPSNGTLGLLGKKWTVPVIGEMAFYGTGRFNRLIEDIPGISPRILATRLRELEAEGIVRRTVNPLRPTTTRWEITRRGLDIVPVLMMLRGYEATWCDAGSSSNRRFRKVHEFFTAEAMQFLQRRL